MCVHTHTHSLQKDSIKSQHSVLSLLIFHCTVVVQDYFCTSQLEIPKGININ